MAKLSEEKLEEYALLYLVRFGQDHFGKSMTMEETEFMKWVFKQEGATDHTFFPLIYSRVRRMCRGEIEK